MIAGIRNIIIVFSDKLKASCQRFQLRLQSAAVFLFLDMLFQKRNGIFLFVLFYIIISQCQDCLFIISLQGNCAVTRIHKAVIISQVSVIFRHLHINTPVISIILQSFLIFQNRVIINSFFFVFLRLLKIFFVFHRFLHCGSKRCIPGGHKQAGHHQNH